MRLLALTPLLCSLLLLGADPPPPPPPPDAAGCVKVTVPTTDGLNLAADHCKAKQDGAPAVVLLHMIPPHHDRTNYPVELRAALVEAGFEVLNLDRRGAGDSQGDPKEAYTGPKGKLDVQAALDWLRSNSTADPERWACVGASNGTTSCLDYVAHTEAYEGTVPPRALVFLTGGPYTETQTKLARTAVTHLPLLFVHDTKEAAWSEAQKAVPHDGPWRWEHLEPGGHGTRAFAKHPELFATLVGFLTEHLEPAR